MRIMARSAPRLVMAGHSRSKNGVLSHAYVPAIPLRDATLCIPKRDHRDKPGDDSRMLGDALP